jgi:hypothetical protein
MIVKPTILRSIHHPKIYRSILSSMCPCERQLEENEDNTADNKNPDPRGSGLGGVVGECV